MHEYENIFKKYKNYYLFYIAKHEDANVFLKEVFLHPNLIHQKNSSGETLSHILCYEGMTEKYYPFLEMGGDNTITYNNDNVLHYCVSSGADTFLMIDLINKGIDPLLKNKFGQTPIHMLNSLQASSYFSNWNFRTFSKMEKLTDIEGNTIIHSAAINKHPEIVSFFLKEYPQIKNIKNLLGLTPEQILFLNNHPFINSIYFSNDFRNLFANHLNPNGLIEFKLYYENNNFLLLSFSKDKYELFLISNNNKISFDKIKFKIQRENLSKIPKLKPLSLQILKYEAKELFKDSTNNISDEEQMYKDTLEKRKEIPVHDFNFDISKNFR